MKRSTLAKQLRSDHERSKSWEKTVAKFPHISKGMAFKIAMEKYDPANEKIRDYYNLGPRPCPTCKHKKPRRRQTRQISRMRTDELLWRLANREVVQ